MEEVKIYDTTLRDGTQGEGINFSKVDKLRIAERLDSFGVAYIEGGWPGSNPKDMGFFEEAKKMNLQHAKFASFGSTRRATNKAADDPNIIALLETETPVCTIFGKTWLLHVTDVLRVEPEVNLEMINDSVAHLVKNGREMVYDAEHFFDGYKDNPEYAIKTLMAAVEGGASSIALCDTNGGTLPSEVTTICEHVITVIPSTVVLGIHTHTDSSLGVANALAGVEAGARQVQGTINGIGERCGNSDLCAIIANLELKMGYKCLPDGNLKHLKDLSNYVDDLANLHPNTRQAFVGESAFAHKGGIHVNAVQKVSRSYEHIEPEKVGNKQRILVSDLSGGSNILMKAAEHNIDIDSKSPEVRQILSELKNLESEGYEYESAGASFELLMRKTVEDFEPSFELEGFRVVVEKRGDGDCFSEATVKVNVNGTTEISAAEGDGPVNALDLALRKSLSRFYPDIKKVQLRDYKVRIIGGDSGTAAKTRVLIESTNGEKFWGTVGVSENIIEASWQALVDSVEYILYEDKEKGKKK
ncbi:MAG: citramalate synthase [Lentisphaeria bacterium]|nr:citramalate synthase [Lentisphaeria bacterium]NQZ69546.1 citramalate synthase [Lentisphaeria bacterium]